MAQKTEQLTYWDDKCPRCGSSNVTQTGDHCSSGANTYECNDCGCTWGN